MLPSEALEKARKLHKRYEFQGLQVSVETRKGAYRHWRDRDGKEGKTLMLYDYGYIRGTKGADKEHLDCYVGPNPKADKVYVVNQRRVTDWRKFDEHKVMLGFDSEKAAKEAYLKHYTDDRFFGSITEMTMERFKRWAFDGTAIVPVHKATENVIIRSLAIALLKALTPPGSGWQAIPKGKRGGFRRRKGSGWEYWYPETGSSAVRGRTYEWSEEDYAAGKFDKNPAHWQYFQVKPGMPPIGWTDGGLDPSSKKPVKEAGLPNRLFRIVKAQHSPGWAELEDIRTGEKRIVQQERVHAVFYERPVRTSAHKPRKTSAGGVPVPGTPAKPAAQSWNKPIATYAESNAAQGTALYLMEHGAFSRTSVRAYEQDATGNPVLIRKMQTIVDQHTLAKLVVEFGPLLSSAAAKSRKKYKLDKQADEDLKSYAAEALIRAAYSYEGGRSFSGHAKAYVEGFVSYYAAKEAFGAQTISDREMRLVSKYMAAKSVAMAKLGTDNPGPAAVCRYWKIKKRDLHPFEKSDPQRGEDVPLGGYTLKIKSTVSGKKVTEAEGTKRQPGRLELARRVHALIEGNRDGVRLQDVEAVLPGPNVGIGLSPEEVVTVQSSLAKLLPTMDKFEATLGDGRKKTTYRVDAGALLSSVLGLTEEKTIRQLSATMPVHSKRGEEWVKLSATAAQEVMPKLLDSALRHAAVELGIERGGSLLTRAKAKLLPQTEVKPGPTFGQWLEARSRQVPEEDVRSWRGKERDRFRKVRDRLQAELRSVSGTDKTLEADLHDAKERLRELDSLSNREIARRIVMQKATEATPEIRKLMTSTVSIESPSKGMNLGWRVATITNEQTGAQRRVRIRTYRLEKSDSAQTTPEHWMLASAAKYPNLFRLRFSTGKLGEL